MKNEKRVLEPGAKRYHLKRREAFDVAKATVANPERRRGIVPAHDTGRKMVKTPPSFRDLRLDNRKLLNPLVLIRNAVQCAQKMPLSMQRNKRLDYRVWCCLWV